MFLDRDGTINIEKNYVYRPADWEWIPGSIEAIKSLNEEGLVVVIVSNQSGVARGFYKKRDVDALQNFVAAELAKHKARVDAFYYCPHHPDFGAACRCRKPAPGLLLRAREEWRIDFARSYMVGDKVIDVETARAAGVRPILVRTGAGTEAQARLSNDIPVVADLRAAAEWIKADLAKGRR